MEFANAMLVIKPYFDNDVDLSLELMDILNNLNNFRNNFLSDKKKNLTNERNELMMMKKERPTWPHT